MVTKEKNTKLWGIGYLKAILLFKEWENISQFTLELSILPLIQTVSGFVGW